MLQNGIGSDDAFIMRYRAYKFKERPPSTASM